MHIKFICVHCKKQGISREDIYELRGGEAWTCPYCGKITIIKLEPMR